MIPYSENDHLIIAYGSKNILIQVTGKKIGLQPELGIDAETVQFTKHDVVANIGTEPEPGLSLLGCTFMPRHALPVFERCPTLVLFGHPDLSKRCTKAFKRLLKTAEKYNMTEALNRCTQISFVQQTTKKTHKFSSKFLKDIWQDQISVFVDEKMVVEDIENNLLRALTESVHFHLLGMKRRVKWLVLFNKLRSIKKLTSDQLQTILEDFIEQGDAKDVKNVMHEDIVPVADMVFKQIARANAISVRELEQLTSEPETLREIWPAEIQIAEGRPDLDRSILRSVTTLFSYAVTSHLTGVDVGKTLTKAVKNTLKDL